MKIILTMIWLFVFYSFVPQKRTYVGSTPAHLILRSFLDISLRDSIDFIRWKLETESDRYKLQCQYGLSRPNTPGFENGKSLVFEGSLTETKDRYDLKYNNRQISLLKVNGNLIHFLDGQNAMLSGNGGYSYALNNTEPVTSDQFNLRSVQETTLAPQVFEGRTPCQELSTLLNLNKGAACHKMKWYFIFYTDSITGKPSYYLEGGMRYRKENMKRGKWSMITKENGRIIYQVDIDNGAYLYLLKGEDNILFFTDAEGHLLVGNEDFSYTLNRRKDEYPPSR